MVELNSAIPVPVIAGKIVYVSYDAGAAGDSGTGTTIETNTKTMRAREINLDPFLAKDVYPLVCCIFRSRIDSKESHQTILLVGCSQGFICRYNLDKSRLEMLRYKLDDISIMQGVWCPRDQNIKDADYLLIGSQISIGIVCLAPY